MYNYKSGYNFTCVFVYTGYAIKHINNRKSLQKCSPDLRLWFCNFWNTRISTKLISNIIYVYVNKKIMFSKLFRRPTLAFPGKWSKELFPFQISMRKHFSRELQFERFWSRQIIHSFHSVLLMFFRQSVWKTLPLHLPFSQIFMKDSMSLIPV
jgi:hypothetical protein